MTMDVPEDVFFGTSLRKCVCFSVMAEFSMVFLFGLEFEFLKDLWIESPWHQYQQCSSEYSVMAGSCQAE